MVKAEDSTPDELIELGISLCRRAKWRDAIDPLQRAVTLDPTRVVAHYQLGDAYNQTDRLTDALEAYESAAKLQPDHWRALKGIGVILDRLGRPHEATAAYQKAREAQRR
jgi:Flp pilus assembly protein TadD